MSEIRLIFEPRDMWIGVFWDTSEQFMLADHAPLKTLMRITKVYVCLIPMFPIRLTFTREALSKPTTL